MSDALDNLASVISRGLNEKSPDLLASVKALFGSRYHQNDWKSDDGLRNRYAMGEDGVPLGALLHEATPRLLNMNMRTFTAACAPISSRTSRRPA